MISFLNQPILQYSNEIRSAVLIVHGDKAHSYYFGKDAYENMIKDMQIDGTVLDVEWENNNTVKELKEELKQGEVTIRLSKYSDFEQVGELGKTYSSSDKRITAEAGDIMLYSGNKIVVFYGANTWEYTRIGKIKNLSKEEIKRLLSNSDVVLKIKME
ncbi:MULTISPECIES: cyclophilin-like fold protein [Treponema]|uniref:Cyclophilin-like domain-containing protein n=2 Tax=Treponema TaxID=157 RepID=M2BKT7_TREDN|nr:MULTISPECIES: cyclophilin-like fold protein [Treponema]EMB22103.1 hypothetical protein HMPREF9733_02440 [Treponema denticola SP33]EPF35776.1 hypothetical protein HMPREF9732_02004 [Treponema denticola SP32]TWI78926.1 hypothetical protein JM98_00510 [Treponema putidum]